LPFKTAHAIASRVVRDSAAAPGARPIAILVGAAREVAGLELQMSEDDLTRVLSPEYFVQVRRTLGGPAPEVVAAALDEARASLTADEAERSRRRESLAAAEEKLRKAVKEI
jgi:argininosuccinate lyase